LHMKFCQANGLRAKIQAEDACRCRHRLEIPNPKS
jgi:hypothetical protein